MTVTILDAQSAAHSGVMDVREWAEEFMQEWMRPLIEMQEKRDAQKVVTFWDQLPPEAQTMMEKASPVAYAQAKKKIAEMRKKVNDG